MTLRNLLLRAYPRSWRNEYGAELAGILAHRRLTPGVAADVLWNAAKQHLFRDTPWKLCGTGLALWFAMVRPVAAVFHTHSRLFLLCYWATGFLLPAVAGALTVRREHSGIRHATQAAARAALVGNIVAALAYLEAIHLYWSKLILGYPLYFWFLKTMAMSFVISAAFGFAGALAGRAFDRPASLTPPSH